MTYRIPTLNSLRAFDAAARHRSFKIAASELGVTPGAISQQVRKLEAELGIMLFRRNANSLELTKEGATYQPRVSAAFDDLTAATEAIAPDLNARKFTLGICPKVATLLPKDWSGRSSALKAFVRETILTSELEPVLDNRMDGLVRTEGAVPVGLSACDVATGPRDPGFQYVCRQGVMNCRQSQAIIDHFRALLA